MGRRIILLSDGTGNSSASFWRTNVWRMFEALDLSGNDQVAFYDDGVGTSSFKPLAILGGAFGFGLKRNVIALYTFACRNHHNPADDIFGFGFSRGAFTIRVLMGLILDQGLVPAKEISESELEAEAARAYRRYHRRHFHTNWWYIARVIGKLFGFEGKDDHKPPHPVPNIRFLGLWDTVAAYGLPVDEMTRGVSQWISPLELPNHTLSPVIKRACHALSLDDERTTFHPVLWNERGQSPQPGPKKYTKQETISQVWFAGVHANVGGGYPDDSLARIPLYWIMEEAKECGLAFKKPPALPDSLTETKWAQDKDGRVYDSRGGFGMYYRFGPRRLSKLCNQVFSRSLKDEVYVERPKIHESVFKRIQNNAHVYAPIGIPENYELVVTEPIDEDTTYFRVDSLPANAAAAVKDKVSPVYETATDALARVHSERRAIWPLVYGRALLYVLTAITTALFIAFPFSGRPDPLNEIGILRWVSDIIRAVSAFLPSWAGGWFVGYASEPVALIVFVVLLTVLIITSGKIEASTQDRMAGLWQESLAHSIKDPGGPDGRLYRWTSVVVGILNVALKEYIVPALTALVIIYGVIFFGSHAAFNVFDDAGLTCTSIGTPQDVPVGGVLISFKPSELCHASGYKVARLGRYLVWTNPNPAELSEKYPHRVDGKQSCLLSEVGPLKNADVRTSPAGYATFQNTKEGGLTWSQTIRHALLVPLRRDLYRPWFQMIGRYGVLGGEEEFLDPDPDSAVVKISEIVQPKIKGELFFYVNDAVIGVPGLFDLLYGDNEGCISVFIQPR